MLHQMQLQYFVLSLYRKYIYSFELSSCHEILNMHLYLIFDIMLDIISSYILHWCYQENYHLLLKESR